MRYTTLQEAIDNEMASYLLVSATTSDRTPGVEVSDPECPINIEDHPAALAWAQEQGWGNDPDELIYVVAAGSDEADEIPDGLPVYQLTASTS